MNVGRVARNIGAGYLGSVVNGVSVLILTPLVIRRLGPAQYGLWVLTAAVGSYLGFLNAGSGATGTRSVATLAGTGKWQEASREVGSVFRLYLGVGLLAAVVLALLGIFALDRFHIPPEQQPTARILLLLIAVNFLVSFPCGVTRSVLAGLHHFTPLNVIEMGTALFRLGASATLLLGGRGLIALGVVQLGASILGHAARALVIRRLVPRLHLTGGPGFSGMVPGVSWFSLLSFGYESIRTLFENADLLLLGILAGPQAVGAFAVCLTLASLVPKGLQPVSGVLFPLASLTEALDRKDRAARLLEVGTRVKLALAMPVVALLAVDGGPLLRLWTGEDSFGAAPVLAVLAAASLAGAASLTSTTLLFGAGRVKSLLGAETVRYVLNVILVIAGYRWGGLLGVALASLIAVVAVDAFLVLRRACPWAGTESRAFLSRSVMGPVLTGLPVVAGLALWAHLDPEPTLPLLLVREGAGLAGFALLYALSGTFREERRLVGQAWAEGFR